MLIVEPPIHESIGVVKVLASPDTIKLIVQSLSDLTTPPTKVFPLPESMMLI